MGLVCASVYILSLILFIPFAFSTPIREQAIAKKASEGLVVAEFPHYQVCPLLNSVRVANQKSSVSSVPFIPAVSAHCHIAWFPR